MNLAVETTRAQQSRVQNIRAVCRRDQDDVGLGVKTIHFHQELVKSLFPLIVPTTHTGTSVATHGVNFVHENDRGSILFGLREKVSHAGCSDPHEHLDKI